jgi:hypothetical protein
MNVRVARDLYLAENGFTTDEYEKTFGWLLVLGVRVPLPNFESRKKALPLHDLHHVALGFGTDVAGELEVSAWEHRTGTKGCGWWPRFLCFQAMVVGFLTSPRRTLAAWCAAAGQRSLYDAPLPYETLLAMTVAELRAHLRVPRTGLGRYPRAHGAAPGLDATTAPEPRLVRA